MGMSASQARLLTITGRITDNEMRSQTITNAKLRLAQKSSEASQVYMNALSSEKLVFKSYNENGQSSTCNLTPALIYSYEPLKNQYSIQNASGQNLVSATDAKNFEESNDLQSFLDKYGLIDGVGLNKDYDAELEKYNKWKNEYDEKAKEHKKYIEYVANMEVYKEKYAKYEADLANYNIEKKEYDLRVKYFKNTTDLYETFKNIVGTSSNPNSCYQTALNGGTGCYVHVLAHLLDYQGGSNCSNIDYKTSNGKFVKFNEHDVDRSALHYDGKSQSFVGLSNAINNSQSVNIGKNDDGSDILADLTPYCDGDDDSSTDGKQNILQAKIDNGEEITDIDILKSDYVYDKANNKVAVDENGNPKVKTIRQKIIDLLYLLKETEYFKVSTPDSASEEEKNQEIAKKKAEIKETLINFTDGDMKKVSNVGEEPQKPQEPTKPTEVKDVELPEEVKKPVKSTFDFTLNDRDKAQWYINLWYLMNGSESANKVQSSTDKDGKTIYGVANDVDEKTQTGNSLKDTSSKNYKVIDDQLLTSSDWLTFALKNGIVTLKQASYYDPTKQSNKAPELATEGFYWNATAYSSTTDIVSVEDEVAIAKAEVKYKNTTTEIENQDKKYDQDLKKLDTEHNALQTEYESLKNVIDKNVERSFKAFS